MQWNSTKTLPEYGKEVLTIGSVNGEFRQYTITCLEYVRKRIGFNGEPQLIWEGITNEAFTVELWAELKDPNLIYENNPPTKEK